MAAVQAEDIRASFLFVGDLNGHHQEWLGSTTTNRHGVAVVDFATVTGCDQFVVDPTHERGGTLDLLVTDVPDLVRAAIVASTGNSDHSSLLAVISVGRHAFGLKQEAHLRWTRDRSPVNKEELVRCQVRANETHSEPKRQFSVKNKDVLIYECPVSS